MREDSIVGMTLDEYSLYGTCVGMWVTYAGKTRPYLKGKKFQIKAESPMSAAFEAGKERGWCSKQALIITTSPEQDRKAMAKNEISTRDKILAEMQTLRTRLDALQATLDVIDSL